MARLVEYGLLTGFWAANRQRPRGRYAYALTRATRLALERSIWPEGQKKLFNNAPEGVSPVIHGLASHDVLAAFLRASDGASGVGLAAWVSERPLIRMTWHAGLRPDALAVIRVGERSILLAIERDLGTERGPILAGKVDSYQRIYDVRRYTAPLHVGFVVNSARRAASVRSRLRGTDKDDSVVTTWVVTEPALATDPYGAIWTTPGGTDARVVDFEPALDRRSLAVFGAWRPRRSDDPRGPRRPGISADPDAGRRAVSGKVARVPQRVPGASRRTSRDRVATAGRRPTRHPARACRAQGAEVRHHYREFIIQRPPVTMPRRPPRTQPTTTERSRRNR